MERSVTPWRVLDAEVEPTTAAPVPSGRTMAAAGPPWRSWPIVGGLAGAAVLAAVAIALVVSGPSPVAIVTADAAPVVAASGRDPAAGGDSASVASPVAGATGTRIVVHVAGAVRRPGLVELPAGARVADAIEAAGGLGPRVDAARLGSDINLAALVADGERVVVPSRDDAPVAAAPSADGDGRGGQGTIPGSGTSNGPVDLNHASAEALIALPGIGEVTAGRIIEARTERPFATVDELLERKVVGPATLAKIRDLVVVR